MNGLVAEEARRTIQVLLVEDDPGDVLLVRTFLAEDSSQSYDITHVSTAREAVRLGGVSGFDIVVTDLGLPDSQGLATVDAMLGAFPDAPVVVLTGVEDRGIGSLSVQHGCQDFLVKGFHDSQLLQRTLCHAIERSIAAKSLREGEARYRSVVEACPDAILVIGEGRLLMANRASVAAFGAASLDDLLGVRPERLLGPLTFSLFPDRPRVQGHGEVTRFESFVRRVDGSTFDAEVVACSVPHRGQRAIQLMVRDITARKRAERDYLLAAAVFDTTDEAILVTDAENRIVAVNPSFERVTGFMAGDVKGLNPNCLSSGRHDTAFYRKMWGELLSSGHWRGEIWNRRANGEIYVQRVTMSLVRDASGAVVNHVAVFSDITDAKQEAERIRYRASYDALTNLPNRGLLHDRLQLALAKTTRQRGRLGLLFLDLDGFKQVNDKFGHLSGDLLLIEVAQRLKACVRESDTVARLGGDEFVIVLSDMVTTADAFLIASKVLAALSTPFRRDKFSADIGASVGIAVYPDHGRTPEELLDAADRAMYAAKKNGKAGYAMAESNSPLASAC